VTLRQAIALALICAAIPAFAADQVGIKPGFSDSKGRQAVFNVQFPDAPPLQAGNAGAGTVAGEFERICLTADFDASKIDAAAAESSLELERSTLRYLGDRNTAPFDIDGWHGPSADVRLWMGASDAFRKLPFYIVDSGVVITGPMKNLPHQCNLDIASNGLADFPGLVRTLSEHIGSEPEYQKSGKRWGQASWRFSSPQGASIIGLRVDDLNRPAQLLHLGMVRIAEAD
jgi:hypothetical protein